MKIAIVSMANPVTGSGVGTTEYAYQLILRLREIKGNTVDSYYAIPDSKRNDALGLIYAYTVFKKQVERLARLDYDVVHITIQELGFVARILKEGGSDAKIITTVHDLIRLKKELHKGVLQSSYNKLVKGSIEDALKYSDYITFNSSQTKEEVAARFGALKNSTVIWHGTRRSFLKTPIPKKKKGSTFVVGYIGSFGPHKNAMAILETAALIKDKNIKFQVYGSGVDEKNILRFKKRKNLTNVAIKGPVRESSLVKTYDGFGAFMLPSLQEGLSHQILEAGARGIPVIIFKKALIPERVAKYCFRAKNVADAAKIIGALSKTGYRAAERNRAMGYYRRFSWDKTVELIYGLYKELIAKKSA
jgi:glycosyltransferase involved in cell wall biosynthesis